MDKIKENIDLDSKAVSLVETPYQPGHIVVSEAVQCNANDALQNMFGVMNQLQSDPKTQWLTQNLNQMDYTIDLSTLSGCNFWIDREGAVTLKFKYSTPEFMAGDLCHLMIHLTDTQRRDNAVRDVLSSTPLFKMAHVIDNTYNPTYSQIGCFIRDSYSLFVCEDFAGDVEEYVKEQNEALLSHAYIRQVVIPYTKARLDGDTRYCKEVERVINLPARHEYAEPRKLFNQRLAEISNICRVRSRAS